VDEREKENREETKMNKTDEMLEMIRDVENNPCLCYNFRKVTRSISQLYDEALKPTGLRDTQYALLYVTGSRQPINFNDIAKITSSDKTTIARNLKVLEGKGLVYFEAGEDRREREVSLTKKGQEILLKAYPLWKSIQDRVKNVMGKNRIDQLLNDLSAVLTDIPRV